MALIKCNECQKEISDKAISCPFCGNPTQQQPKDSIMKVEVERTSKYWKKRGLIGAFLVLLTFITMFSSPGLGSFFLFVTLGWVVYVGIGRWWSNG